MQPINFDRMWLGAKRPAGAAVTPKGRIFIFSTTKQPLTFTLWAKNQPNNSGKAEDCVQMTDKGFWDDINCNFKGIDEDWVN